MVRNYVLKLMNTKVREELLNSGKCDHTKAIGLIGGVSLIAIVCSVFKLYVLLILVKII